MKCKLEMIKENIVKPCRELTWKGWLGVVGAVIVGCLLSCMYIEVYLAVVALTIVGYCFLYGVAYYKCREPRKHR